MANLHKNPETQQGTEKNEVNLNLSVDIAIRTSHALSIAIKAYRETEDGYAAKSKTYTNTLDYLLGLNADLAKAIDQFYFEISNVEPQ